MCAALNAAGEEEWVGERLERLPWWRPPKDDELTPQEGTVYVDYLGEAPPLSGRSLTWRHS